MSETGRGGEATTVIRLYDEWSRADGRDGRIASCSRLRLFVHASVSEPDSALTMLDSKEHR